MGLLFSDYIECTVRTEGGCEDIGGADLVAAELRPLAADRGARLLVGEHAVAGLVHLAEQTLAVL